MKQVNIKISEDLYDKLRLVAFNRKKTMKSLILKGLDIVFEEEENEVR